MVKLGARKPLVPTRPALIPSSSSSSSASSPFLSSLLPCPRFILLGPYVLTTLSRSYIRHFFGMDWSDDTRALRLAYWAEFGRPVASSSSSTSSSPLSVSNPALASVLLPPVAAETAVSVSTPQSPAQHSSSSSSSSEVVVISNCLSGLGAERYDTDSDMVPHVPIGRAQGQPVHSLAQLAQIVHDALTKFQESTRASRKAKRAAATENHPPSSPLSASSSPSASSSTTPAGALDSLTLELVNGRVLVLPLSSLQHDTAQLMAWHNVSRPTSQDLAQFVPKP